MSGKRAADPAQDGNASSPRGKGLRILWSGVFVLGLVLLVAVYVSFIHRARRDVATYGLNGVNGFLIALPPAQMAFIFAGSLAAKIAGRKELAVKWAVVTLLSCALIDCFLWAYVSVGSCLVVC
jgi:hypothetical protein